MRTYRIFMDYPAVSFVVDAKEIEDAFGDIKYGILYNDNEISIRFIKALNGELINIDHIVRIAPCLEPENEKRVTA